MPGRNILNIYFMWIKLSLTNYRYYTKQAMLGLWTFFTKWTMHVSLGFKSVGRFALLVSRHFFHKDIAGRLSTDSVCRGGINALRHTDVTNPNSMLWEHSKLLSITYWPAVCWSPTRVSTYDSMRNKAIFPFRNKDCNKKGTYKTNTAIYYFCKIKVAFLAF